MCHIIDEHLADCSAKTREQWGFCKRSSTESMLLTMTEKWKQALDNSLCVGAEFINFQKAFETVSHLILSRKLQAIGICVISQTDRNYSILLLRAASLPLVVLMLASHRDLSLGQGYILFLSTIFLTVLEILEMSIVC